MLENLAPPSRDILFPHDKFLHGKNPPEQTPAQPHPNAKKSPWKRPVRFIITITVCKQWSKFGTCSPSPGDCGGLIRPQRHSYYIFRLCWTEWLSQNLIRWLWKKMSVGGGLRCPPIFQSLRKGTRTFNFH